MTVRCMAEKMKEIVTTSNRVLTPNFIFFYEESCQNYVVADQIHNLQVIRTGSALGLLFILLACETTAPYLPLFTGKKSERGRHGLRNLFLGLINALITSLAVVALWGL